MNFKVETKMFSRNKGYPQNKIFYVGRYEKHKTSFHTRHLKNYISVVISKASFSFQPLKPNDKVK